MGQFTYLFGLHVVGTLFSLLFKKRLPMPFLCVTGFFWGALLWVIVAVLLLTFSLPYTLASMLLVLGLVVAVLVMFHIKQETWRFTSQELYWLGGSLLVVALAILTAVSTNYSRATNDSLALIVLGRSYAQDGFYAWNISHMANWGVFFPALLSANVFLGQDYLYALSPTISFFYFSTFFIVVYLAVKGRLDNIAPALIVSGVASLLLASTYIIAFHVFYIHVNQPSAAYYLVAVASFWFAASEENNAWLIFATIALFGFGLMRIDGPLFGLIPLVLYLGEGKASYKERLLVTLPLAVLLLLQYIRIALSITATGGLLSPVTALVMVAPMVALAGFTALTRFQVANQFMKQLSYLMLVVLLFLCTAFFLFVPEHMIDSSSALRSNLFTPSQWGFTWFIFLGMVPLFFMKSDLPHEKILSYVLPAYLLLLIDIAFARHQFDNPFHTGLFDSANRLMTQVLPVVVLYGGLKFATVKWTDSKQEYHPHRVVLVLTILGVLLGIVARVCPIRFEHLRDLHRAYQVGIIAVLGSMALVLAAMTISERAARLGYAGFVVLLVLSGIVVNIRNLSYYQAFERRESNRLVELAFSDNHLNWELFEVVYDHYRGKVLLTDLDMKEEIDDTEKKFVWWGGFRMVEHPSTPLTLTAEQVQQFSAVPSTEEVINGRTYVILLPPEPSDEIWFAKYDGEYYFVPVELIDLEVD